ncbi:MAG: hypothetical protein ACM3PW_02190 [Chlamydiota bacterium]
MRRGFLAGAVLVLILAVAQGFGQTWVTNTGFASNRLLWDQFNYPVLSTPMMSLNSVSLSPAGASNATPGNVAGATNATLSISNMGLSSTANMTPPTIPLVSVSGQPTVVGATSSLIGPRPFVPLAAGLGHRFRSRPVRHRMIMARNAPQTVFLNPGAAVFDNAYAIPAAPDNLAQAAQQIRAWGQAHPPVKVYTNQDIDRIHQQDASRPETAIPAPKQ